MLQLKADIKENREKVVSLVVEKDGIYEETYNYRLLKNYNKEYFIDQLIYDATVNHTFVFERRENDSILLLDSKNGKDALWLHPNTNEFELFQYIKMEKKK